MSAPQSTERYIRQHRLSLCSQSFNVSKIGLPPLSLMDGNPRRMRRQCRNFPLHSGPRGKRGGMERRLRNESVKPAQKAAHTAKRIAALLESIPDTFRARDANPWLCRGVRTVGTRGVGHRRPAVQAGQACRLARADPAHQDRPGGAGTRSRCQTARDCRWFERCRLEYGGANHRGEAVSRDRPPRPKPDGAIGGADRVSTRPRQPSSIRARLPDIASERGS